MSTIAELQRRTGEINIANGWRTPTEEARTGKDLVNAQITRLALITTEVSEAIEEIRNGRSADETWYSSKVNGTTYGWVKGDEIPLPALGYVAKPEGVPSELADVVIRALDAADAWGIDLESMIEEKLAFNATRGYRHGGKTA